ncbi:MAG TPA: hypothetical protein PLX35_08925 [Cyclobacteriaceae bacterium]|nr:hypothetical protein [Cyclobacteriaceae bacterium]
MGTVHTKNTPTYKAVPWESLYAITRHWQSDLQFYRDEIRFLRNLTDRRLVWLSDDQLIVKLRTVGNALTELTHDRQELEKKITEHFRRVSAADAARLDQALSDFQIEHALLEEDFAAFTRKFRNLKKSLFTLAEQSAEGSIRHEEFQS